MSKRWVVSILLILVLVVSYLPAAAASPSTMIGINVLLKEDASPALLADLGKYGTVRDVLYEIDALTMQVRLGDLGTIQALPYVAAANPDAERTGAPVDLVAATDFADGVNTWDLDAINVTNYGAGRTAAYDGTGVYVAVLDTGLVDTWRMYFPEERIAEEYATSFVGMNGVADQPNKWEHDQNSHGTHVTSTILGYNFLGMQINGVAPMSTVIPVKVLNQNGSGWTSAIAAGIVYVANLKEGPLVNYPVVINMSLGGGALEAVEKAAIDYAISKGVIIVASAGNNGTRGMGYPGAYAPVISVAASGWVGEWSVPGSWWRNLDVEDPTAAEDFYITNFSSREKAGQDLDVAAPGSWIVGPYKVNSGMSLSYYYLGGTSMASPHVAGIVALMAQKNPSLTAQEAESYLETSAIAMSAGCVDTAMDGHICWGSDATGAGLATADAALEAMDSNQAQPGKHQKKP